MVGCQVGSEGIWKIEKGTATFSSSAPKEYEFHGLYYHWTQRKGVLLTTSLSGVIH